MLPLNIACSKCKPPLERISLGYSVRSKFNSCLQPWSGKWGTHRVIGYVELHNNIHDYIGNVHHKGDTFYKCIECPLTKVGDIVPPPSEPSPKGDETSEIEHDTEVHLDKATNEN